ncbi:Cytoplasmic GTPase/eEF2-like protein (ribosomal biogenesis) [Glugoides intestinalis]
MPKSKITSIIAHIDHGKTTLLDSVIASTGYFSKSLIGELRYLDSRKDEQERGITMKLSPIKLSNGHVFIDTPGHVDFENLIFSSSVLCDNHLILIDVNEGITPRTCSLIKFINRCRCILFINKIDKCDDFQAIDHLVMQINGLLGDEVFSWNRNNVILGSTMHGAGICYRTFKYCPKNNLYQAFRAFKALDMKITNNDAENIIKKYNIKFNNKKLIFGAVMPLYIAVCDTIDFIYENCEKDDLKIALDAVNINSGTLNENIGKFQIKTAFYTINAQETPSFSGVTAYSVLKDRNILEKENILFFLKCISGTLKKGDLVYSCNGIEKKTVCVEGIFDFSIDDFIEVDSFTGPGIVFIKGDFLKNSAISPIPVDFNLPCALTPFYMSKLVLDDLDRINELKRTLKIIAITEQNLKVKLNKYSEFEFKCSGNVQFEKICFDLREHGFKFTIKQAKKEFREHSTIKTQKTLNENDTKIEIIVGPISKDDIVPNSDQTHIKRIEETNNIYYIDKGTDTCIIESVLDAFTNAGPLIKEFVTNTFFFIRASREIDITLFSILKNELSYIYQDSKPSITPLCFTLRFSVTHSFVSIVYTCLQKTTFIVTKEEYNDESKFTTIVCKVPQFTLNNLVDDVIIKTKGTAYLEILSSEYLDLADFSYLIPDIRKEKGLYTDEKIVQNPEKQRTLKR